LNQFRLGEAANFLADQVQQVFFQRVVGFHAIHRRDKGVDALAFDIMGIPHHSGLGDLVVQHQGALHLGGADTVTGHVDHVVDAPGDPVVAVFIASRTVTGEIVAGVGFEIGVDHALRIAVHTADLPRPTGLYRQHATAGAAEFLAVFIQQHGLHAEHRLGGAARLDTLRADQGAEHDAAGLGLPPGIHNRAALLAYGVEVPVPGFRVDRFADAAQ